jgi:hypothetical protein
MPEYYLKPDGMDSFSSKLNSQNYYPHHHQAVVYDELAMISVLHRELKFQSAPH